MSEGFSPKCLILPENWFLNQNNSYHEYPNAKKNSQIVSTLILNYSNKLLQPNHTANQQK